MEFDIQFHQTLLILECRPGLLDVDLQSLEMFLRNALGSPFSESGLKAANALPQLEKTDILQHNCRSHFGEDVRLSGPCSIF